MIDQYFAKDVPQTPVHIRSGIGIKFQTVDGITGYYRTADIRLASHLDSCIANHICGVRRISKEEYDAFEESKKNSPPRPLWRREEISPGQYARNTSDPAAAGRSGGTATKGPNLALATGTPPQPRMAAPKPGAEEPVKLAPIWLTDEEVAELRRSLREK